MSEIRVGGRQANDPKDNYGKHYDEVFKARPKIVKKRGSRTGFCKCGYMADPPVCTKCHSYTDGDAPVSDVY